MSDFLIALLIYGIAATFTMLFRKDKRRPPVLRQPYERRPANTSRPADARPSSSPMPYPAETPGKPSTTDMTVRGDLPEQEYDEEGTEGTTLEGDFSTGWPEDPSDPEGVSLEGPDASELDKALPGKESPQPFEAREVGTTSTGDILGEWKEEELVWDQAIRDDAAREISWDDEVMPAAKPALDEPAGAAAQQVSGGTGRAGHGAIGVAVGKQDQWLWPASAQDVVRGFVYAEILHPPLALRRGQR